MNGSEAPTQHLLLLPGVLSDEEVWARQIAGLSDLVQPFVAKLDADSPEGMVCCALEGAPERFALAGHSMGAWVAIELTLRHPKRIARLCLITTSAELDSPQVLLQRQKPFNPAVVQRWVSTPHVRPQVLAMFERNRHLYRPQQAALRQRRSTLDLLHTISVPTLVIGAEHDTQYLAATRRIAERIPHAHLEIVSESGHMVTLEQPDRVTALMREWLK